MIIMPRHQRLKLAMDANLVGYWHPGNCSPFDPDQAVVFTLQRHHQISLSMWSLVPMERPVTHQNEQHVSVRLMRQSQKSS
jgi:hypothetical protein